VSLSTAFVLNLVLVLFCAWLRLLSPSGLAAGFLIGTLVAGSLGWGGWVVLVAFFLAGTAATYVQYGRKRELGVAQMGGGRRRWRHAWANAGAGCACGLLAALARRRGLEAWLECWTWAFVASFAAALSDTLSSEFGQLAGQKPRLITTGEEVEVGTDGGITRAGTLVGVLGALLLTLTGRFLGLVPVRATLPVMAAGLSGNLFDSYLGATLQRRGLLSNDWVNFSNTIFGAALGLAGFWFMRLLPAWLARWGLGTDRILHLLV
jgi:uncharacterized protein (TIGR00297 family)